MSQPNLLFKLLFLCLKIAFMLYGDKKTRNDPSAGSPTDALLRLLFPLDHTVRLSFHKCL